MTATSSIDFLRITINLGGNKATIREMLELFVHSTDTLLPEFEAALNSADSKACKDVLHKIKGGAQNMAASRLAELCKEAELKATTGTPPHEAKEAIQQEFMQVKTAIEQHLAKLAG